MRRKIPWTGIIVFLSVLIVAELIAAVFYFVLPWFDALNSLSDNTSCQLYRLEDGTLSITWTEAQGANDYVIEIYQLTDDGEENILFLTETDGTTCILPNMDSAGECTIRIQSATIYQTPLAEKSRYGDQICEYTIDLSAPELDDFSFLIDEDADTLTITYSISQTDTCHILLLEDDGQQELSTTQEETICISFGSDSTLPMPERGETVELSFYVTRRGDGISYCGLVCQTVQVTREDLLDRDTQATCTDLGENVFQFTWAETKGDAYQVQCYDTDSQEWVAVCTVEMDQEFTYTTPHLTHFSSFLYRIVAVGGQTDDSGYAAVSQEFLCETGVTTVFCTVWPVKALTTYSDWEKTSTVGTVAALTACCVLAEQDGLFEIVVDGQHCYIESDYCMINLVDYLGDLCSYDITNSYDALYMVHEFEIPTVTGTVICGYEDVQLADGSQLVPLLYPTAQKLLVAAQSAIEQGYRLKIYDSYRPNEATLMLYTTTEALLSQTLPEEPYYTNVDIESLDLPQTSTTQQVDEDGTVTEVPVSLTYRQIMLGSYTLSAFLAKSVSAHNRGVALDLTLEDLETGDELSMQTRLHDLSHYSVRANNTETADLLSDFMTGAGFATLVSEWWHFQDDEVCTRLSLPAMSTGVSIKGWTADDNGWRYLRADGTCYTDCTKEIGGVSYTFDSDGYANVSW